MRNIQEGEMNIGKGISGAIFSGNRQYRYALWRVWDREKPAVIFIGFNPSTADEIHNDQTVWKMAWYAKYWGYGGIYIGNLFALVSTSPYDLISMHRINGKQGIGKDNNKYLQEIKRVAGIIVVGWGNNAEYSDRHKEVLDLLGRPLYCFNVTKKGYPSHPLYLANDIQLKEYLSDPYFKG